MSNASSRSGPQLVVCEGWWVTRSDAEKINNAPPHERAAIAAREGIRKVNVVMRGLPQVSKRKINKHVVATGNG